MGADGDRAELDEAMRGPFVEACAVAPGDCAGGPELSRYRFIILGVVWLTYLMVYLARLSVGPLAPFLREAFSLSNAGIGMLVSATAAIYAPTLIVAGGLVDRVGCRRMLLAGTGLATASVLALPFAGTYGVLLALLAVSGLGTGCIYPAAVKSVIEWFPRRERATAIGFNQTAVNVSGIVGAAALPSIALSLGWQYGFLAIGICGVVIFLVCALAFRNPPRSSAAASAPEKGARPPLFNVRLLRSRDIRFLAAAGFFLGVLEFSALAYIVLYLTQDLMISAVAAGGLLALCEATGALGKPLSGVVSDRLLGGRRRPALVALALIGGAACIPLAFTDSGMWWGAYVSIILIGLCGIGWMGLFGTLAGEIGGLERAGQVAGLTSAFTNIGILVGPPVFGALVDVTGSYRSSWLMLAAVGAVAAACLFAVREAGQVAIKTGVEAAVES
jgi:ACS family hexuronate transporter-like MFS transporter